MNQGGNLYSYREILSLVKCRIPQPIDNIKGRPIIYSAEESILTHVLNRNGGSPDKVLGYNQLHSFLQSKDIKEKDRETLYSVIENPELIHFDINKPQNRDYSFTFADIFCNVGGATLALMESGGRCVLAIDNGKYPYRRGYFMNYGILPHPKPEILDGEYPKVDILFASVNLRDMPYEKGKKQKVDDFYDTDWYLLLDIINKTKPKAVIIESCKTQKDEILQKSTSTAYRTLKETTGYYVTSPAYLDAIDYGVPQLRKRVWFVAFENPLSALNFKWPKPIKLTTKLKDVLETENINPSCYLSTEHIDFIERSNDINKKRGYWYIYNPLDKESYSKSILLGGQGWDRNIIEDIENKPSILPNGKKCNEKGIRRLTTKEIYRLQGFPDDFLRIDGWRTTWTFMARSTNVAVVKHILREVMISIDTNEINKSAKTLLNMGLNFNL